MVLDFIKIILLIFLVIVVLIDIPKNKTLKDPYYQFVFACIILLILLAVDVGIGFILAIIMFIIYYKVYSKILKNNNDKDTNTNKSNKEINKNTYNQSIDNSKLDYMNKEHLIAAQTNIFDTKSYNTEVKGFKHGYNNEPVVSAQGLNLDKSNISGFDDKYYLSYNLNDYFN